MQLPKYFVMIPYTYLPLINIKPTCPSTDFKHLLHINCPQLSVEMDCSGWNFEEDVEEMLGFFTAESEC
jgi:hypothetical protein